ncbi:MAG: hypothetical protein J4215_03555 [Candidatus Diapherotrites archaeon]|uniref:Uncharacterized protein n=1 Tax=Candidatus Iainarchaeum sp. TaxID=3101447 RepID=A0A8T4L2X9_9ARCH|nr:hypothetical protein [Candidatus Diapherotrites archaeon]
MRARGSSVIPVFVWITILIVTIAASYWYLSKFSSEKNDFEKIQNDLTILRKMVDDGCQSVYYQVSFNPVTETGDLNITKNAICMNLRTLSRCQTPVCVHPLTDANINLSDIRQITVIKNDTNTITITAK